MLRPRSLRHRFTLVMLTASISFGIAVSGVTYQEVRSVLLQRTREAADATLRSQVRPLSDLVLVEDTLGLREAMHEVLEANPRWLAVEVIEVRGSGAFLATRWPEGDARNATIAAELDGHRLPPPHRSVHRAALIDPGVGEVRAIIDLSPDFRAARNAVSHLLIAMAALTVAGVVVATLLGRWLTAPLEAMAVQVRRIQRGELGLQGSVPDGDDEVAVLAHAINDMSQALATARQERERHQRAMAEVEKLSAVGTMAAGVAHEVSNPLSGALTLVRRLRNPDLPEARRNRYVDLIEDGLERALRVLRDLLAYARADVRGPTDSPMDDIVGRALELAGHRRGCTVTSAGGPPITVCLPRDPVDQVMSNLVLNAVRAAESRVEVSWHLEGDTVRIDIVDDGPGIPPELRERVFEPFFTTAAPGEGTGLGLSVTRSLLTALGGTVQLLPRPDGRRGTLAVVHLPLTHPHEATDVA
ncbi:MAG: sensor histidine kinase [Deltaproteobacteria bacterium]|nr:MAG: sensor histidine kinase [Deltaproteobacteria bacterium]